MDKAELNAKLGYNRELLNQLSNAFDLQEDYNDYGWDKLFEICRYIYNLEQQCQKQKEVIDKLELENKVLKEQMVAMVKPNYTYGIR